jgi:DNA-binding HxlR family transcriptional regulator
MLVKRRGQVNYRDPTRQEPRPTKPTCSPDEQDCRSIVDVLEKHGRGVSMMVLGRDRRRWLERPPRDPASLHPNRLTDVLARMIRDGVLRKVGARYVPGPRYAAYLEWKPLAVG